ncbi:MAG: EAL domain-containing protein [Nevskia sp.]|nr:EAL domain-containing protein [Nevskia sp.]
MNSGSTDPSRREWTWETDAVGQFIYCGGRCEELLGYSASELLNLSVFDLAVPRETGPFADLVLQRSAFRLMKNAIRHRDGQVLEVVTEGEPVFNRAGRYLGIRATTYGRSDPADRPLQPSAGEGEYLELCGHLVGAAREAMIVVDDAFGIVMLNPSAERIFGYAAADLMSRSIQDLLPAARRQAHWSYMQDFARSGATARKMGQAMEVTGVKANGTEVLLEASIASVRVRGRQLFSVTLEDLSERKRLQERLSQLAEIDPLTNLPNRRSFLERLRETLQAGHNASIPVAVFVIDLDRFKNINDTLGHHVGDEILAKIAERLRLDWESKMTLARLGGDEFAAIVMDAGTPAEREALARRIRASVTGPVLCEVHDVNLTASIGISCFPADGDDEQVLLRNAEIAMYSAKGRGRNEVCQYAPRINPHSRDRLALESALRRAVDRADFELHFQPKIDLKRRRIVAVEALVRWRRGPDNLVYPGDFIGVAEETGLIYPITEWVLDSACRSAAAWARQAGRTLPVAVNLSALHFDHGNLVEDIGAILQRTQADPRMLEIELTESAMMANSELTSRALRELHAMGMTISIDDFGTGYSSLAYLSQLLLNSLKIDRSFVHGIDRSASQRAIVKAIIALAHNLNLRVIAEGIESAAQLDFLLAHGCDEGQGFYFSRAVPEAELLKLLGRQDVDAAGAGPA